MSRSVPAPELRWFITGHCMNRMREMNVGRAEVLEAISNPELDYPGGDQVKYPDGRRVYTRGRLAVVAHPLRRDVITVLWNHAESRDAVDNDGATC